MITLQHWPIAKALFLAVTIVIVEYLARGFVALWLPTLGATRVNDMIVSAFAYFGLVWFTFPSNQRNARVVRHQLERILAFRQNRQVQLAAVLAIATGYLAFIDQWLWQGITLPFFESSWYSPYRVMTPLAPLLAVLSLLLVNGIFVPIAEEWLWRGRIQPSLTAAFRPVLGITLTALLFSLKHAIVDGSLARLLSLMAFGLVMGWLANRLSWQASAGAHVLANLTATALALIINRGTL